jgi:hypothetical protein
MGDVLPFPQRDEEYPWATVKDVIEAVVKRSEGLPESAPGAVAQRMKVDALRWIDHAVEISSGIGPLERARLLTFLSEVIASRITAEMEFEREREQA